MCRFYGSPIKQEKDDQPHYRKNTNDIVEFDFDLDTIDDMDDIIEEEKEHLQDFEQQIEDMKSTYEFDYDKNRGIMDVFCFISPNTQYNISKILYSNIFYSVMSTIYFLAFRVSSYSSIS